MLVRVFVDGFYILFARAYALRSKQIDYLVDGVSFGDCDRDLLEVALHFGEFRNDLAVVHLGVESVLAREERAFVAPLVYEEQIERPVVADYAVLFEQKAQLFARDVFGDGHGHFAVGFDKRHNVVAHGDYIVRKERRDSEHYENIYARFEQKAAVPDKRPHLFDGSLIPRYLGLVFAFLRGLFRRVSFDRRRFRAFAVEFGELGGRLVGKMVVDIQFLRSAYAVERAHVGEMQSERRFRLVRFGTRRLFAGDFRKQQIVGKGRGLGKFGFQWCGSLVGTRPAFYRRYIVVKQIIKFF